jgi:hypothetical protein
VSAPGSCRRKRHRFREKVDCKVVHCLRIEAGNAVVDVHVRVYRLVAMGAWPTIPGSAAQKTTKSLPPNAFSLLYAMSGTGGGP